MKPNSIDHSIDDHSDDSSVIAGRANPRQATVTTSPQSQYTVYHTSLPHLSLHDTITCGFRTAMATSLYESLIRK